MYGRASYVRRGAKPQYELRAAYMPDVTRAGAPPELILEEDAMGAAARILHPSSLMCEPMENADKRPEPITHSPRSGRHADRRDRDEPIQLARRRHRAWRRAPAVKEARGRREPRIVVAPGQGQDAEAGPKAF